MNTINGPTMRIDIGIVTNLLRTRIAEGKDKLKDANVSNPWRKQELYIQDKLSKALKLLNEAMNVKDNDPEKEASANESSQKNTSGEESCN